MSTDWSNIVARPEALEPRRLLSATVVNGTLHIVGTNTGDAIVVYAPPPPPVGRHLRRPPPRAGEQRAPRGVPIPRGRHHRRLRPRAGGGRRRPARRPQRARPGRARPLAHRRRPRQR